MPAEALVGATAVKPWGSTEAAGCVRFIHACNVHNQRTGERVLWQSYPAWSYFTWLYLFSALAALRGVLHTALDVPGREMWLIGAGLLLACVALVRRWMRYVITPAEVAVRNGYTGGEIDAIAYRDITSVAIMQGPIARLFGIGTLYIHAGGSGRFIRFRGIKDPEVVKRRIEALKPAQPPV